MPDTELDTVLAAGVESVLETMFFAPILGPAGPVVEGPCLRARVRFTGFREGRLEVILSEASAHTIASDFLGMDFGEEPEPSQVGEVMLEMANIICGSVLSRLGGNTAFDLRPPELLPPESDPPPSPEDDNHARQGFELEQGSIVVALELAAEQ